MSAKVFPQSEILDKIIEIAIIKEQLASQAQELATIAEYCDEEGVLAS